MLWWRRCGQPWGHPLWEWGPPCAGDSREDSPSAGAVRLGTALGQPLGLPHPALPGCGPGDGPGDPPLPGYGAGDSPGDPALQRLWAWRQPWGPPSAGAGDSSGTPFCPGVRVGAVSAGGAGLGDAPGDLSDTHHCRGCRVEGWVPMDPLPEVWGWGTILQTPTPKEHPRDTDELCDRSVGSRAPSIPSARGGHFWGCPWRLPVLRI